MDYYENSDQDQSQPGSSPPLEASNLTATAHYAAAIMHEINNPLEAALNLNYLLQAEADHPDKVRTYCRLLDEQLHILVRIAHQTLSFYRPQEIKEPTPLAMLADAAIRIHQKKIAARNIRLLRNLSSDAMVMAHSGEILQVLSNLVANALDALPDHGVLQLRVRRRGQRVDVLVADNGHGIPGPIHTRIFEPFFTTKKERGTGLGLAISKTIVEKHQGKIRSRSSVLPGRSGTAFRLSFPLAP